MPFLQETFPVSGFDSCLPGYVTGQMNVGRCSEQLDKEDVVKLEVIDPFEEGENEEEKERNRRILQGVR